MVPANGQAGERITLRTIRYYRAVGLPDPPQAGGGQGFTEKHRLQLVVVRIAYFQTLDRLQDWASFHIPVCPGIR